MSWEAPTATAVRIVLVAVLLLPLAQALPGILPPGLDGALEADFVHSDPAPREPITFTSSSTDRNNAIILLEWTIVGEDAGLLPLTGEQIQHTFAHPGNYQVTLTATNALLIQRSITKVVAVPNTPPDVGIEVSSIHAYRGGTIDFFDLSTDPDGDAIVASSWETEGLTLHGRNVSHTYATVGIHDVHHRVQDARGAEAWGEVRVFISNQGPVVSASYRPTDPAVGAPVTFEASGFDPDSSDELTYRWQFEDGALVYGQTVTRSFEQSGSHWFSLSGFDSEGGYSHTGPTYFHVRP